jgi:hypothetical protein
MAFSIATSAAVPFAAEPQPPVMGIQMVAKLTEVALYCQSVAAATPGSSLASAVREFLAQYSRHPTNPATGYYAQYTAPKNWDVIMTDLWKCIPAVSDPTQRYPELLCYDCTDLMIMILAVLGVNARSVRLIATNPINYNSNGTPLYLDHTLAEVYFGAPINKWVIQDAFYNFECLTDASTFASVDDVCGAKHLDDIIVRNKSVTGGFSHVGAIGLAVQDFFAAAEHRDVGGGTPVIASGQSVTFPGAGSTVILNGNRADFSRIVVHPNGQLIQLRKIIAASTLHPTPLVTEIKPLA